MVFTNKQIQTKMKLIFGTELIREQEECVFLGVKLDSNLKFHVQTSRGEVVRMSALSADII